MTAGEAAASLALDVHGIGVTVSVSDPLLRADAETTTAPFCSVIPGPSDPGVLALHAVGAGDPAGAPGPAARELARGMQAGGVSWPWVLWDDDGRTVVEWSDIARMELQADVPVATVWIAEPSEVAADARASVIFLALSEILRRRGLFAVHAAAAQRDDEVVLLLGESGAGKTTALLSLLAAGFSLVSDDHPLLRVPEHGPVEVLPFTLPIRVTPETRRRYPGFGVENAHPGAHKEHVVLDPAMSPPGPGGRAAALLFCEITASPRTLLAPLPAIRALERCLSLTVGLAASGREVARQHFSAIGRLASGTPAFQLQSGQAVERDLAPAVLHALGLPR